MINNSWIPSDEDMDWLSKKYPDTFDKYYRPRWEYIKKQKAEGKDYMNLGLTTNCQVCQLPMIFTEPDDPTKLCNRELVYKGERYHFCSDQCQHIFENESEKYVQSWLPIPQLFQEPMGGDLMKWMDWVSLKNGDDNGDYAESSDKENFEQWKKMAMSNE